MRRRFRAGVHDQLWYGFMLYGDVESPFHREYCPVAAFAASDDGSYIGRANLAVCEYGSAVRTVKPLCQLAVQRGFTDRGQFRIISFGIKSSTHR